MWFAQDLGLLVKTTRRMLSNDLAKGASAIYSGKE